MGKKEAWNDARGRNWLPACVQGNDALNADLLYDLAINLTPKQLLRGRDLIGTRFHEVDFYELAIIDEFDDDRRLRDVWSVQEWHGQRVADCGPGPIPLGRNSIEGLLVKCKRLRGLVGMLMLRDTLCDGQDLVMARLRLPRRGCNASYFRAIVSAPQKCVDFFRASKTIAHRPAAVAGVERPRGEFGTFGDVAEKRSIKATSHRRRRVRHRFA
ncbi:unnamed protein product [Soboliphyme baturini]|uniref:START domain-containing protein n=1 Tax=Soboliphyme baturini TaxID=241478 RepID=A0A183ICY5_9BILA|nr:unnamed protein product [Soboliphyme baturini]